MCAKSVIMKKILSVAKMAWTVYETETCTALTVLISFLNLMNY